MKIAIVISSPEAENVWNALRFGNMALGYDNDVVIFLLGRGVEIVASHSLKYNIHEQLEIFREYEGKLMGCGVCVESRSDTHPLLKEELQCELGSMQDLYMLIASADKILNF
ncbi:MAG: DsrE family protein [Gammaproteobacteria bacterium]|nr:DsrE family protein [Gammaproteobacteria bacterium]MDH5727523.1 DsrE family protein [Gammaproteobacteria bacterium]